MMDGQVYLTKLRKAFAQMIESAQSMTDSEIRVAFHWFTSGADWRGTQQIYTDERVVALLDARDATIAAQAAEIKRLEAQLAATWQPIEAQTMAERRTINCACIDGCRDTVIVYPNDILQVVNEIEQRYADMRLPHNVRLCEQVQP